jgi:7-cyano-7-deazaguanine synthase in queuosine biosynthesis
MRLTKNINRDKLLTMSIEKNSTKKEYLIDKEVYTNEKPIKDMAVTVSDIRNQAMVSCVDVFNKRLLESFGLFYQES